MKIVSKFKDYYDSGMKYGIDKECLYIREQQDIDVSLFKTIDYLSWERDNRRKKNGLIMFDDFSYDDISMRPFLIGFCGNLYHGIKLSYSEQVSPYLDKTISFYFYEYESIKKFYDKRFKDLSKTDLFGVKKTKQRFARSGKDYYGCENRIDWFFKSNASEFSDVFVKYKVPIFVVEQEGIRSEKNILTLNPILHKYGFERIKNPRQTFQEIYMYISGVLGTPSRPMIQISDKDMRDKKGFDEWSFKTRPSKK